MRKTSILLIILLISTLLFTGCGGNSAPAPSPAPVPAAPKEESLADLLAKGKQVEGLYFEYTMTADKITAEGKTWVKGMKTKMETKAQGETIINLINLEKGEALAYIPSQKMALRMDLNKVKAETAKSPTDYSGQVDPLKAKVMETTTYNGMKCKVIVVEEVKMWISEEYGIPVRVESTAGGVKVVMEYKNIKAGPIPDETFQLPAGIQIMDMAKMPQMPQMPKMPGS